MNITQRDIAITVLVTLLGVILIAATFFVVSGMKQGKKYDTNIEQIKNKSFKDQNEQESEESQYQETEQKEEKIIFGTTQEIKNNTIFVKEKETGEIFSIEITSSTEIKYNGKNFDKSEMYAGDILTVNAERSKKPQWEAIKIILTSSASPAAEAPVLKGLEQSPTGELKPLGGE